jgi:RES domain-containing protein
MRVYRISKAVHVATALSGQGAALYAGRWNSKGVRLACTAGSVALAMLELLVHVDKEDAPTGLRLLSYELPDDAVQRLDALPPGWSDLPYSRAVQAVGDRWIASARSLALHVPSAVARHESNVLVNPGHARFADVAWVANEALVLDARLFD